MNELIILKIGGSVITEKNREGVARKKQIERIAREISQDAKNLILVHGAGSYGHPLVQRGETPLAMHESVKQLNSLFMDALDRAGVRAMPVHPMGCAVMRNGRIKSMMTAQISALLDRSYVPVLHGDVTVDETKGFAILSGDQIVVYLAKKSHAARVGMGTDVDGILANSDVVRKINSGDFHKIKKYIGLSGSIDVTRGMLGKVEELIKLAKFGIPSCVFNATKENAVRKFLAGKDTGGTVIS